MTCLARVPLLIAGIGNATLLQMKVTANGVDINLADGTTGDGLALFARIGSTEAAHCEFVTQSERS